MCGMVCKIEIKKNKSHVQETQCEREREREKQLSGKKKIKKKRKKRTMHVLVNSFKVIILVFLLQRSLTIGYRVYE